MCTPIVVLTIVAALGVVATCSHAPTAPTSAAVDIGGQWAGSRDGIKPGLTSSLRRNSTRNPSDLQDRLMTRALRYADLYAGWPNDLEACVVLTREVDPATPGPPAGWNARPSGNMRRCAWRHWPTR